MRSNDDVQSGCNGKCAVIERATELTESILAHPQVCDWIFSVVAMKPWCGEPEPSKCPAGEVWSDCAVPCGKACHYFAKDLVKKGLCSHGANVCEEGCVESTRIQSCPPRHLWRDNKICVGLADCPCMSNDGSLVMVNNSPELLKLIRSFQFCFADFSRAPPTKNQSVRYVSASTALIFVMQRFARSVKLTCIMWKTLTSNQPNVSSTFRPYNLDVCFNIISVYCLLNRSGSVHACTDNHIQYSNAPSRL